MLHKKIISMSSHPKFFSRLFLQNVKKTNYIENICFYGALQKMTHLQFHRYNKIDGLISFTMTRSRSVNTAFANFWKIKFWEANENIFSKKWHYFFVACFYRKKSEYLKNGICEYKELNFLQNNACFSLPGRKLWEEKYF